MKFKLLSLLSMVALCSSVPAFAWDCSVWTSNVPGDECYKPPVTPGSNQTVSQNQSQSQGQQQNQSQSQNVSHSGNSTVNDTVSPTLSNTLLNTGGNSTNTVSNTLTNTGGNSANTNTNSANGGQGGSATASNQGNSQTINVNQPRIAPSVAQGALMISGCGVGANAGGSNIKGSAFLGIEFTPSECYLYMTAQAYAAIGQLKAACEIINLTRSAQRLKKAGIDLPVCVDAVQQPAIEAPREVQKPVVVNVTYPAAPVVQPVIEAVKPLQTPKKKAVKKHKVVCPKPVTR